MNRKMTLLLIAAVAALLPAVAVADVMITGEITLESFHQHTAFEFEKGSNYGVANATDSIGWTPLDGNYMGQIDLQGNQYTTTKMINVIDLNITVSNAAAPASFSGLYLNVSGSTLPVGTIMVIANASLTFAVLTGTPVTHYAAGDPAIVLPQNSAIAVDLSENPLILLSPLVKQQVFHIGFIIPPGTYAGHTATLTGQFVKLA